MRLLARALAGLLDVLAPPSCAACEQPCPGERPFCQACGAWPALAPELFDGLPLVVVGGYTPPLSTAIVRFKYQGRSELAAPLARLLVPALVELALPADTTLAPIPLHPRKLARRGYNQAALLAQELSRETRYRCLPRLLARTRETEQQAGQTRAARLENTSGAFVLRQPTRASVVLVDDVVTTGSTVRACAQALARGGVRLAAIVALARAEQDCSS